MPLRSLTVFELADECYRQVAQASGDQPYLAERPFLVEVIPSLVAGLLTE